MPRNAAYVTLLTSPGYLPGVLVLHASLVAVGSKYPLVAAVTPKLSEDARDVLRKRGVMVREVEPLRPEEGTHQLSDHDARFAETWTKLRCFEFVEYDRLVALDSDMIVMRNMDELMELDLPPDWIAAAHVCACNPRKLAHYPADWIPQNCAYTHLVHPDALTHPTEITPSSPRPHTQLNSGTFVLNPSLELAAGLQHFLATSPLVPTFSFPDQDLLTAYFKGRWKPLPWCYNALKTLRVIHKPLWRDEEIRCLHYILTDKPWHQPPGTGGDYEDINRWWRDRYHAVATEMREADPEGFALVDSAVAKN